MFWFSCFSQRMLQRNVIVCSKTFENSFKLPDLAAYIPTSYSWKAKKCYFFSVSCSAKHLFDILKGKRVIQWAFFGSFEQQKKIRNGQHRYPVVLQKKLTDNANSALIIANFFLFVFEANRSSFFSSGPGEFRAKLRGIYVVRF